MAGRHRDGTQSQQQGNGGKGGSARCVTQPAGRVGSSWLFPLAGPGRSVPTQHSLVQAHPPGGEGRETSTNKARKREETRVGGERARHAELIHGAQVCWH